MPMDLRQAGAQEVAHSLLNAFVFSGLRRGKQLQLWDSNVHNKETQYGGVWQVLGKCHK